MGTQELKGLMTVIIMFLVELWKNYGRKNSQTNYGSLLIVI